MMNFLIRTDASVQIGSGHAMRCLTLAEGLREQGASIEFICREHPGHLIEFIRQVKGFTVHSLPFVEHDNVPSDSETRHAFWLGSDWQTDAAALAKILKQEQLQPVDWLIVDHYSLGIRWEQNLRSLVNKIMVIDDLADRQHDCDILLDQNFYLKKNRYQGLVPMHCVQLLGPQYSLLRKEFPEARKNLRERTGEIKHILIFFGGSDPTNETQKAVEAVCQINRPDIAVDVVIGQVNPHREQLEHLITPFSNIQLHVQVDYMASLMRDSDLAIGAGGSTTWERCCLGVPAITISIAKNQHQLSLDLSDRKVQIYLGFSDSVKSGDIRSQLNSLLSNANQVKFLSENSFSITDGNGLSNVIRKLIRV
jgi:UDP-2,4-diacetamido-2,4,6-trideoxy-beta-L-altropyranose hydrolase